MGRTSSALTRRTTAVLGAACGLFASQSQIASGPWLTQRFRDLRESPRAGGGRSRRGSDSRGPTALAAPTAATNPPQAQESCIDLNSGTQCQSPGNVQIDDSPTGPIYPYYGDYPFYGGYHGGYGGYGGGHGGGGGHR
jgi:hypothetical protein